MGHLTPLRRLVSASYSSGQRFAFGFLQIRSHPRHPCRSANSSPCRASRGLSPPSKCALPGAPIKKPRYAGLFPTDFITLRQTLFIAIINYLPVRLTLRRGSYLMNTQVGTLIFLFLIQAQTHCCFQDTIDQCAPYQCHTDCHCSHD